MTELSFPDDWDDRSITYLGAFRSLDDVERRKLLRDTFETDGYKFFSGIALALAMLYTNDKTRMTPSLAYDASNYGDLPKLAAIEALSIAEDGFDRDNRGPLNTLHKQICFLLFEAVLEMKSVRKLVLKNKASTFTVIADRRSVCVSFEINGHMDGGAQTLASMATSWLAIRGFDDEAPKVQIGRFVTSKHSSAFATYSNVGPEYRAQMWDALVKQYQLFRSIGPLKISIDLEPDSAWNLVVKGLRPLNEYSSFSLKVRSLGE
jgi:hypothetical protein